MPVLVDSLELGEQYERPELAALWGYKDWHAIGRGAFTPASQPYIVLFITKEKQEALAQYEDHFEGDVLHIDGETNHATDQRIVNSGASGDEIHLFYRDRHHLPFTYYGRIHLQSFELQADAPSRFAFTTSKAEADANGAIATEARAHGTVDEGFAGDSEGKKTVRLHVSYERSRKNRAAALAIHGTRCKVCGFDFNEVYGEELAHDYIEVHHTASIADAAGKVVNPATDLAPVCSNCHSMAHRDRNRIMPIEELRALVLKHRS